MVHTPLPQGFFKLNFDGDSKGSPGDTEARGVIRDCKGKIYRVFFINLGHASNNVVKFHALKQGMEIFVEEKMFNVTLEGFDDYHASDEDASMGHVGKQGNK